MTLASKHVKSHANKRMAFVRCRICYKPKSEHRQASHSFKATGTALTLSVCVYVYVDWCQQFTVSSRVKPCLTQVGI